MRKAAILFLCIFAVGAVLAEDASAPRSKAEIVARWEGAKPTYLDWQNMEVYGDLNPPIAIGKPKADYIDDGLKMVNFLRYLARMTLDCFGDADIRNVAKVGHRRNMMRPEIAKVGFGYVDVYEEVLLDADEIADAKCSFRVTLDMNSRLGS